MFIRKVIVLLVVLTIASTIHAQVTRPTYAEKLGYPKGAKVLIIHVHIIMISLLLLIISVRHSYPENNNRFYLHGLQNFTHDK